MSIPKEVVPATQPKARGAAPRQRLLLLGLFAALAVSGVACAQRQSSDRRTGGGALADGSGKAYSAEELFGRMEERLMKARALTFEVEGAAERQPAERFRGSAALADGNRMRLELVFQRDGQEKKALLIANGTRMAHAEGNTPLAFRDVEKDLNKDFLSLFARFGVHAYFAPVDLHLHDLWPRQFKLGKKEEVAGRAAQAIEYELNIYGRGSAAPEGAAVPASLFRAVVWLDAETGLPLKREVSELGKEQKEKVTETYTRWALDGVIDGKTFELPK
jgi:hypothetical protein